MVRRLSLLILLPAAVGAVVLATGAEPAPDQPSAAVRNEPADPMLIVSDRADGNPNALRRFWDWSDTRVRGMVEYILPDTLEESTFRFSLQPRAGDIIRHDHIRLPMSVSYGFSERVEGEVGFDPYFPNPFKDGRGSGAANIRGAVKVQWEPGVDNAVRAATGFRVVRPLSSAPFEFNHGMNRYSLFQTFARPSPWNPRLEGFLSLSYDVLTPSRANGSIKEKNPQDDFYQIGAGWLMRKKGFVYGLAVSYAHTTDGVSTSYTSITPSVIFDVPPRFAFNSPGQWQLGASVEGKRYGDETAVDFKVRVRWNVDYRKVVKDWREARTRERMQASSR